MIKASESKKKTVKVQACHQFYEQAACTKTRKQQVPRFAITAILSKNIMAQVVKSGGFKKFVANGNSARWQICH